MNKLSALYTVVKHVKEMEKVNGSAHGEILFGETVIGKVDAKVICEDGKCTKQAEAQFGEETIKFERTGSDEGGCCGGLGHHGHIGHAHGHKFAHPHGKMKGHSKLGKAMMMLKLLDKTEYEELASGQKTLSLEMTMADLPEGMRVQMEAHLNYKRNHLKKMMASCCGEAKNGECCEPETDCCSPEANCCSPEANCCETENDCCSPIGNCCSSETNCCSSESNCHTHILKQLIASGCMDVNPDTIAPEKISIKMLLDESGKPLQADLLVVVNSKLITGEAKDLRLSFSAQLI